jgi:hypothetical protein
MRRRDFIKIVGSAAAWPLAARAQQPAMPVVGVLGSSSSPAENSLVEGLKETGFIDGQNVRIEYRWARGAYDRLPGMADELINLPVNVLVAFGSAAVPVAIRRSHRHLGCKLCGATGTVNVANVCRGLLIERLVPLSQLPALVGAT